MKRVYLFLLICSVVAEIQSAAYQWHQQFGLPVAPPYSFFPSMAYDSVRGLTLYVPGRVNGEDDFKGTWRWDGSAWTEPTDASSTERSNAVAMAFDTLRGVAVLYCMSGQSRDDALRRGITWEWNGSSWRLASTNAPTNRDGTAMAFDANRGRTVLFGGEFFTTQPAWTWEWDGMRWRIMATNGPSRRVACAMAYDAKRRVTVLFGGHDDLNIKKRDTWTWNGNDWTPVSVAGPVARSHHTMIYDSVREKVLLYGGLGEDDPSGMEGRGDLWEWDGTQWILSSEFGPRHYRAVMAFDSRRGEGVLFGGDRDRIALRETWLLKLHETWVDFSYFGIETGTFATPFNTLSEGVNAAPFGSALKIKSGTSPERLTISKQLNVQAFGGPVTIGR